jgi:hypothetical protein
MITFYYQAQRSVRERQENNIDRVITENIATIYFHLLFLSHYFPLLILSSPLSISILYFVLLLGLENG